MPFDDAEELVNQFAAATPTPARATRGRTTSQAVATPAASPATAAAPSQLELPPAAAAGRRGDRKKAAAPTFILD